ncbi:MAG TPA: hypothetical protein VLA56_13710 [Pseudomonadales bacterium]|nr:hypothetical protein [Pseudomonadales bacterium]
MPIAPGPWITAALLVAGLAAGAGAATAVAPPPASGNPDCTAAAVAEDPVAARRACLPGRARGNPVDGYNLALALYPTAPREAREHLEWAADAGLAEASQLLGNLLLDAGATDAGLQRLEAAAWAGLALAQYDYATALVERNDPGDLAEAIRWYGRAAAGGENAARYNIAVVLLGGHAGPTRPLDAWAWLSSLDAMNRHAEVLRMAGELSAQMDATELARAAAELEAVRRDPVAASARLADRVAAAATEGR